MPNHTRYTAMNIARSIVTSAGHVHGEAMQNFIDASIMWQVILRTDVTPRQVADCQEAYKIVRTIEGGSNIDNYVDRIGYASLAAEAQGIKVEDIVAIGKPNDEDTTPTF